MATIKTTYGTQGVAITMTLASLANDAARESTAIDNTTNLFLDALVFLTIKTAAAATSATGFVNLYAYGTANNGTDYSGTATGTDAAITLTVPPNVRLIGIINAVVDATSYKGGPFSVAAAFGGILPQKWGLILENKTGAALDATAGSFLKVYQGVFATVA